MRVATPVDLDVLIRRVEGSTQRLDCLVRFLPEGEHRHDLVLPFEPGEAEAHLMRLSRQGSRRLERSSERAVRKFGTQLFEAIFVGPGEGLYRLALDAAREAGRRLHINLHLEDRSVRAIPWEYLYDSENDLHPALSQDATIVRLMEGPSPAGPDLSSKPVRIVCMIAEPTDRRAVNGETERQQLMAKIEPLISSGDALLKFTVNGTLEALRAEISRDRYDVLYFIGHGEYDEEHDDGLLALETRHGHSHIIPGRKLATLAAGRGLQLVVLNACEGAKQSPHDRFAGAAASLVAKGLPATISMQYEIESDAAVAFGPTLIEALVRTGSTVEAMTAARQAILSLPQSEVEWGTPVLHQAKPRAPASNRQHGSVADEQLRSAWRTFVVSAALSCLLGLVAFGTLQCRSEDQAVPPTADFAESVIGSDEKFAAVEPLESLLSPDGGPSDDGARSLLRPIEGSRPR